MKVWIVKGDYNGRWCFDAENSSTSSSLIYDFQDKGIVRDWKKARVSFESGDKKTDILPIQNISYFATNPHLFICDTYAKKKIEEKIEYVQFLQVEPIEKNIADLYDQCAAVFNCAVRHRFPLTHLPVWDIIIVSGR